MRPSERILKAIGITSMCLIVLVSGVVAIHWAVGFISWTGLDSGWAQFIGAIAALAVAIYLGERQHKNSMNVLFLTERRAMEGRLSSVLAILDEAVVRVVFVRNLMLGEGYFAYMRDQFAATKTGTELDVALVYSAIETMMGKRQFDELVEAIDRIPMHELGHAELVSAMFLARKTLRDFDNSLLNIPAKFGETNPNYASIAASAWNGVTVANSLVSTARKQFSTRMEALISPALVS